MVATLDDRTLIEQFVRGDVALAANPNLRVETTFNTSQLMAKRGKLLAKIERNSEVPSALVRPESEYHELIHAALLDSQFTPTLQGADERGFLLYQRCQIPEGYHINYADARQLWKYWYLQRRDRGQIDLDLLILVRQAWYPIRDIAYSQEMLIIDTLTDEVIVHNASPMVWLSRFEDAREEALKTTPPTVNPVAQPARRHFTNYRDMMQEREVSAEAEWRRGVSDQAAQKAVSEFALGGASGANTPTQINREEVFQLRDGKLYVKTAVGELVVEGNNLRFWLNTDASKA